MNRMGLILVSSAVALASCGTPLDKRTGYWGNEPAGVAITRDAASKRAQLHVSAEGRWSLYGGPAAENIDMSKPLFEGEGAGIFDVPADAAARVYFQFNTPEGGAVLAERHLPMEGGYNFRDMGGFRGVGGRYVKWGKALRSDDMSNLTDADLRYLASFPLVSIVDFRTDEERAEAPSRVPATVDSTYIYTIAPGNMSLGSIGDIASLSNEEMMGFMADLNRSIVADEGFIERYRQLFALLQDEDNIPLLFHCSAGKDRTGMAAALFLLSLGVDEDDVIDDYLASNEYLADKYDGMIAKFPTLEPLMRVHREYLAAGLDEMKKRYGSAEAFLVQKLGVDIEKMREMYLY